MQYGFPSASRSTTTVSVVTEGHETSGTAASSDAIGELIRALANVAPGDLATQGARALQTLLRTADSAIEALDNVNAAAKRLNALLDDLEGPLRQILPHAAGALTTLTRLSDAAQVLGDLAGRLGPLAAFVQPQRARTDDPPASTS